MLLRFEISIGCPHQITPGIAGAILFITTVFLLINYIPLCPSQKSAGAFFLKLMVFMRWSWNPERSPHIEFLGNIDPEDDDGSRRVSQLSGN